jgi:hypothetical protein
VRRCARVWPPAAVPAETRRTIYTERTADHALSGRLRAIADRAIGDLWEPMTVLDIALSCKIAGSLDSALFWRSYAQEAGKAIPDPWPIRRCPVCRSEIVPAAIGVLHVVCPVCQPFTVRDQGAEV